MRARMDVAFSQIFLISAIGICLSATRVFAQSGGVAFASDRSVQVIRLEREAATGNPAKELEVANHYHVSAAATSRV